MKKNKLVKFKAYIRQDLANKYNFEKPDIDMLCTKDEVDIHKIKYSAPTYISEIVLLKWNELDDCNFWERIEYRVNVPKWIKRTIEKVAIVVITVILTKMLSGNNC